MTQKEYSEPSNWLFEKKIEKKNYMFTLVIMGGTLLSIDNFLFTLFYAVILHITLNFKFFSMHCCADDASRVRRMPDENESSRVVPHFFSKNLTCLRQVRKSLG